MNIGTSSLCANLLERVEREERTQHTLSVLSALSFCGPCDFFIAGLSGSGSPAFGFLGNMIRDNS